MKIPLVIALAMSTTTAHAYNKNPSDYRVTMSTRVTAGIGPGNVSKKFKGSRSPSSDGLNHLTQ
jgi:hypothetical protein